jgi:hypothetical protein
MAPFLLGLSLFLFGLALLGAIVNLVDPFDERRDAKRRNQARPWKARP